MKVEGVIYKFVVKGRRVKDDYTGLYQQQSHLIYGWAKLDTLNTEFPEWAWKYEWETDEGKKTRLGKGWQRRAIWRDYPGGVKRWIADLSANEIAPRHIDALASVFPQALPVERRSDEVESWKRQVVAQETKVAESAREVEICAGVEAFNENHALDVHFPQHTHSCHSWSGCPFIPVCFEGAAAEVGDLYQIRIPNHCEKEDSDD